MKAELAGQRRAEPAAALIRRDNERAQKRVWPAKLEADETRRLRGRTAVKEVLHVRVRQIRRRQVGRFEKRGCRGTRGSSLDRMRHGPSLRRPLRISSRPSGPGSPERIEARTRSLRHSSSR